MVNDAFEEIADRRCKRAVGRDERADYDRHAGGKNAVFDGSHAAAAAKRRMRSMNVMMRPLVEKSEVVRGAGRKLVGLTIL